MSTPMSSPPDTPVMAEAVLRIRIATGEAHYAGGLVDGARVLQLFGDLATELSIRCDGDEGLFRAYEQVEFLAPLAAGDYVEARGRLVAVGRTSRRMEFEAHKVIAPAPEVGPTAADVIAEPVLVARARGTTVTPVDRQRGAAQ